MDRALMNANDALDAASKVLSSGGLKCQREVVVEDVERFHAILKVLHVKLSTLQGDEHVKVAVEALGSISSYALMITVVGAKAPMMQVLFYSEVAALSEQAHHGGDQIARFIDGVPSRGALIDHQKHQESARRVIEWADVSDEAAQLEALAFFSRLWKLYGSVSDPVIISVKEKVTGMATQDVKDHIAKLPDWYIIEQELVFLRSINADNAEQPSSFEAYHRPSRTFVEIRPLDLTVERDGNGHSEAARETSSRAVIQSRVSLWRSIRHRNVAACIGASHFAQPSPFVALELCTEGALDKYLRQNESRRVQHAIGLVLQAAEGVLAMHSAGIVHGDLRCSNISVTSDQVAKVGGFEHSFDWNALRFRMLIDKPAVELGIRVSKAIRWLAPECLLGQVPSPASDVFAFGLVMYEAFTGIMPFDELDDACILELKCRQADGLLPRQPDGNNINRDAWVLMQDACSRDPLRRPSMQVVMMTLRGMMGLKTIATTYKPSKTAGGREHFATLPLDTNPDTYDASSVLIQQKHHVEADPRAITLSGSSKIAPYPVLQQPDATSPPLSTEPTASPVVITNSRKKLLRLAFVAAVIVAVVLLSILLTEKSSTSNTSSGGYPTLTPTPSWTPATSSPTPAAYVSTIADQFTASRLSGITVSNDGYIFVSDYSQIFRFQDDAASNLPSYPYAGGYSSGYNDAYGTAAQFSEIRGLAASNNLIFIADAQNRRVRTLDTTSAYVSTAAGDGTWSNQDGYALSASFGVITSITVDDSRNVYIGDEGWYSMRLLSWSTWSVSTYVVSTGYVSSVSATVSGVIYYASGHGIVQVSPGGSTTTLIAGSYSEAGYVDGDALVARFNTISGIVVSAAKNCLYIADRYNHCIRLLDLASGTVSTYAGRCTNWGTEDGGAFDSFFYEPGAIALGPGGVVYVADGGYQYARVRRIAQERFGAVSA